MPSLQTRQAARQLIVSLTHLLPCSLCRDHLQEKLATTCPVTDEVLASRRSFGEYIVRLRDIVKRKHVLPDGSYWPSHTFDEHVVDRLLRPPERKVSLTAFVIVVVLLLLVIAWLYTARNEYPRAFS
jgi:hypothetical protein